MPTCRRREVTQVGTKVEKKMVPVPPERKPFLTARQVGLVAAFGGLGFAWRALGLVIPLYPPYVLDIREVVNILGAVAGGPYVGIAIGILLALPSGVPFADLAYYPGSAILFALMAKAIWPLKKPRQWIIMILSVILIEYLWAMPSFAFMLQVFGMAPFWPEYLASAFGGTGYIYTAIMIVALALAIRMAPDFMKPTWSWRRGGEVYEEDKE